MLTAEPRGQGSSWYAATRAESPPRARLSVELDVDVCIIGAGLAGLTAAREIARRNWSVVVLETQSVAWDASGRNLGVVRPGFPLGAQALVERVGLEQARELWKLSVAGAEYVRHSAREMPDVSLAETGWLEVATTDHVKPMAAEAALLVGEFGTLVEPWSSDRVREVLPTSHYFHGLHHPHGFSLHPLNYALGLAAAAEAAGARIFEDTPVVEIDPAGVRKRIVTRGARVRASHVVLAGNVHLAGLLPQFSETLLPMSTTVVATAPLGEVLHETIGYPGAVGDSDLWHQYRVVDGSRLMWMGRGSVWRGKPQRTGQALLRQAARIFPALDDTKAEYAWSGAIGETVHGMPQIGEVSAGLWLLSGFGNHGLHTTAIGGELVARAIVEGDRTWQRFSPFSLVWAGGGLGRAAKLVFGWSDAANRRAAGILARRRELRRLEAEAKAAKIRKFAGLAAAAAAPPTESHGAIHPRLETVAPPVEPVAENVAPVPAEQPEELFPAAALLPPTTRERPIPEFLSAATEPEPRAVPLEPEPAVDAPRTEAAPPPPKRKRGPKKQKSAGRRTTLATLSREIVEEQAAPITDSSIPEDDVPSPGSIDKKV